MEESKLTREIRHFIQKYVPSVGCLETLLFLYQGKQKRWTTQEIARELRSNVLMVADFMAYFESKGLVEKDDPDSYRLNSKHPTLEIRLSELQMYYRERPVSLLNEIYRHPERPDSKIKIFADAFKIKKE